MIKLKFVVFLSIVLHVASPYPNETPKDVENELIRPAVEGLF